MPRDGMPDYDDSKTESERMQEDGFVPEGLSFEEWEAEVDKIIRRIAGVGVNEAGDWPSRDAYNDGASPEVGSYVWAEQQDLLPEELLGEFQQIAEGTL